ncbi:MAG: putative selenate ABC transporter substrate-binding protein [Phycisphaerales bacterium]
MSLRFLMPLLAVVALAASLAAAGCSAADPDSTAASETERVLRFSAIPDQDAAALQAKFDRWAAHLSTELGVKVEYVPAIDYRASVELFRGGDVQLAWFGGLTGVQAREAVAGARAIAQGKADPEYYSYFIAHESTGLERGDAFPAGIADFAFTFGSESSTSGRLMPEYFIRNATGQAPEAFFASAPTFSGSHDKTVELVASGQVPVGAVNYKVYNARVADGRTSADECRVIWRTPPYADYNFTAHPVLDEWFGEGFIDRLQAVLIAVDDPELLAAFPREAMIPAENADFDVIADVARELGFLR